MSDVSPKTGPALGYDPKILLKPEKYLCGICKLIFNTPVQNRCGHRFCEACLKSATPDAPCPLCAEEGEVDEDATLKPESLLPDFAIKKDLRREKAGCLNEGCDWQGKFIKYDEHSANCQFRVKLCEFGCDALSNKEHSESHVAYHLMILLGKINGIKELAGIGQQSPVNVEQTTKVYQKKIATLDKQVEELQRKLGSINLDRQNVEANGSTNHERRQTVPGITEIPESLGPPSFRPQGQARQGAPRSDVAVAACGIAVDIPTVNAFPSSLPPQTRSSQPVRPITTRPDRPAPNTDLSLANMQNQVNAIEAMMVILNNEVDAVINATYKVTQDAKKSEDLMEELRTKIAMLERDMAMKDVALAEKDLRLKHMESTSFDGNYTWQISEFSRKRAEAMTRPTKCIHSPIFYTSRSGYKVNLTLYPDGDGIAKGKHMSVFLIIWKGDYDPILAWPFKQKFTFTLIDQQGRNHIKETLNPDKGMASFKRPQSERNPASGVQLFCPLSRLQDTRQSEYLKDDTMYIKCAIHTDGI